MHRVVVLGGGFGGIAAAIAFRQQLDAVDEVVLVDRRSTFVMGLRKNWSLLEAGALAAGERRLDRLSAKGIQVVNGSVDSIHPAERAVEVDGRRVHANALIVALGAERDPDRIPGTGRNAGPCDRRDPEPVR